MTLEIVNSLPVDEWRRFVDHHPAGNIFHTPDMFQVFNAVKGFKPEIWAVRDANQQLQAAFFPVRISLSRGVSQRLTTRDVAFGSVLCAPGAESHEALRLMLREYQDSARKNTLFTELRNVSSMVDYQPELTEAGFEYEDHLNFLIDLDGPPEQVFKRIGKRTQRNIKRGLNQKRITIEQVFDRSKLAVCYDLLRKTYQLAQVPLPDQSLFEAAFDKLHAKGMLRILLANVEGVAVAVSLELVYKDTIYGWYGGIDRSYRSFMPNELLMWQILSWGAEHGYQRYDFGGAGSPDEEYGVRDFKAKFGGELVCYGRNTWVPSPVLLKVCDLGYSFFRRFL